MFLYIFDFDVAQALIKEGLKLLSEDRDRSVYVFIYNRGLTFDLDNTKHVFSSVLRL